MIHPQLKLISCLTAATLSLMGAHSSRAGELVIVEAESGTLGADFGTASVGGATGITISPTSAEYIPGSADRVATYMFDFTETGSYQLFARVYVGANAWNDDSMFHGVGFGTKSPTLQSDWVMVNGLASAGFTIPSEIVAGGGTAGNLVWKWINLGSFGFTVEEGSLSKTLQIAGREDGLYIDKLAFGTAEIQFTVDDLDNGMVPVYEPTFSTNVFDGPDGIAIHRFDETYQGINRDGANPASGLAAVNGCLFGTTMNGGTNGYGTAFCTSPDGTDFRTITSPTDTMNAYPQGAALPSGIRFFGTSLGGGSSKVGTIFAAQTNGLISVLHSFTALSAHTSVNTGGASPNGPLVLSGNTLYGTARAGGAHANGTVFAVSTNGSGFTVLHDFAVIDSNSGTNSGGALPHGGLILDGNTLYGTASAGGSGGAGIIFSIQTDGTGFSVIHDFEPLDYVTATNAGGAFPSGSLLLADGVLYGTAIAGGSHGEGTVFSIQTDGSGFSALHDFSATDPLTGVNADGAAPGTGLSLSGNVLYGTASAGGTGGAGTVFSLKRSGTDFRTIYSFDELADTGTGSYVVNTQTNRYGAFPTARVIPMGNAVYGTTFAGGPGGAGTVYRIPIPAHLAVSDISSSNLVLDFTGAPLSTNILQATADLGASNVVWQNISTNITDDDGECLFTDVNLSTPARFYRSTTL